jgi:hypothetical protein
MSYSTINQCAADYSLIGRVSAAIAAEQVSPSTVINDMMWSVASKSDVEAAYASALAADNPDPGGDEAVITDGMILAAVQAGLVAALESRA